MIAQGSNEHKVFCKLVTCGRTTTLELAWDVGLEYMQVRRAIKSLRKKGVIIQTLGGGKGSNMEQERFVRYCGHLPPKQAKAIQPIEEKKKMKPLQEYFNKKFSPTSKPTGIAKHPSEAEGVVVKGIYADEVIPVPFIKSRFCNTQFRKMYLHNVSFLKLRHFLDNDHVNTPHGTGGKHPNSLKAIMENGVRFQPKLANSN